MSVLFDIFYGSSFFFFFALTYISLKIDVFPILVVKLVSLYQQSVDIVSSKTVCLEVFCLDVLLLDC